jgi:hypothetical protein
LTIQAVSGSIELQGPVAERQYNTYVRAIEILYKALHARPGKERRPWWGPQWIGEGITVCGFISRWARYANVAVSEMFATSD